MKLRSKSIVPSGGWYYIQPETGFRVDADTLEQLISRVIEHRQYKEIVPTSRKFVAIEIERQICERLKDVGNFVIHG